MIKNFSVIVPAYNCENFITRTLSSIEESIRFYYEKDSNSSPVKAEVIIVNDASTDRTVDVVNELAISKPHYKILSHKSNGGAGAARNTGVRFAEGAAIFFCDGDDLFLPEHIYVCLWILNHSLHPEIKPPLPPTLPQALADYLQSVKLPDRPVDAVKTKLKIKDTIHPYWKENIEYSIPINICIKKQSHELIEGFSEDYANQTLGGEDILYSQCMQVMLNIFRVELETVEYVRYPGNSFDKQINKFQNEPGKHQEDISPENKKLIELRNTVLEQRLFYLQNKLIITSRQVAQTVTQEPPASIMPNSSISEAIELAIKYQKSGRLVQAKQLYRQILSQSPTQEQILYILGAIAHLGGRIPEAVLYYKLALQIKPDFTEVYKHLGIVLQRQGEVAAAQEYLQIALAFEPNSWEVHYNLGMALQQLGQLEAAIASYQQALALNPKCAEIYHQLGKAFQQLKNFSQAIVSYQQALVLKPVKEEVHFNLGLLWEQLGQLETAIGYYHHATKLNPKFFAAYIHLGKAYWQLRQIEPAMSYWEKAFAINPQTTEFEQIRRLIVEQQPAHPLPWYLLGVTAFKRGNYQLATEYIGKAIAIEPANEMFYNNLGAVQLKQGHLEAAMACYQQALLINPNYLKSILVSVVD